MSDSQGSRRRWEGREDLTGEHALTDIGQLVLALLFAGTWIADSFFLHITTLLNGTIHPAIRIPIAAVLLGVSLMAAGVWLAAIGFLHTIARTEERLLTARFGAEYSAYVRDVGMWIPRLRRR